MSEALRAGYKLTEVGVIPEQWRVFLLGDLFKFKNGLNKSKEYFGHGTPIVNYMDVYSKRGLSHREIKGLVDVTKAELKAYEVRKGDVFFTRTSETVDEVGISSILLDDSADTVFSGFVLRGRAQDTCLVDEYKKYCFASNGFRRQIIATSSYTTRALTNGRLLSAISMPVPPKPEQTAIAAALSNIDALLAKLNTLIAKKRYIKQATMQQLLTGQTRLPGFSGEWEVKRVEEFGEVVTGGTPRTDVQEYWGEGFPWITPTDISIDRDMHTSERSITLSGLNSIRSLPKNTVLVTCIASIGKNAILKTEGACNQQINAVIPNHDHCVEFLYYIFEVSKQYLQANAGTSATSMVSKAVFSKMNFLVPSLPEQTAIAAVFSDMDTELAALETRRDKTQALKQGMMQELLTGKIRLV